MVANLPGKGSLDIIRALLFTYCKFKLLVAFPARKSFEIFRLVEQFARKWQAGGIVLPIGSLDGLRVRSLPQRSSELNSQTSNNKSVFLIAGVFFAVGSESEAQNGIFSKSSNQVDPVFGTQFLASK